MATHSRSKAASRITGAILTAELAVMAALVAATAGAAALGWQPYCILTSSMAPAMPAGTLVWVYTHADPASMEQGEVVAYQTASGAQVTHRIVENDPEAGQMVTKGDANEAADPAPVPYGRVIGRSAAFLPGAGALLSQAQANKALLVAGMLMANAALLAAPYLIGRIGRKGRPSA